MKHAILNRDFGCVRTVVVLGVGRGGTSVIAGCLRALGVCMGRDPHLVKHEWSPVVYRSDGRIDLPASYRVIQAMDRENDKWGWKSPRDVFQLDQLLPLLREPGFIFVTRDVLEAAMSGLFYQDVPIYLSLDETALAYRAITTRLRFWPWPTLAVAFSEVLMHPQELVELLCSFLSLQPEKDAKEQAANFVQPGANAYRAFDAKPGDAPILTSAEDLRADRENLAADYSARYGKEYASQFEKVLAEIRKLAASSRALSLNEIVSNALVALMAALPEELSGAGGGEKFGWLRSFSAGRSHTTLDRILQRLAAAADEATRRLQKRSQDSRYEDLTRLYRVLQVTIRVHHVLQGALLAAELEDQRE